MTPLRRRACGRRPRARARRRGSAVVPLAQAGAPGQAATARRASPCRTTKRPAQPSSSAAPCTGSTPGSRIARHGVSRSSPLPARSADIRQQVEIVRRPAPERRGDADRRAGQEAEVRGSASWAGGPAPSHGRLGMASVRARGLPLRSARPDPSGQQRAHPARRISDAAARCRKARARRDATSGTSSGRQRPTGLASASVPPIAMANRTTPSSQATAVEAHIGRNGAKARGAAVVEQETELCRAARGATASSASARSSEATIGRMSSSAPASSPASGLAITLRIDSASGRVVEQAELLQAQRQRIAASRPARREAAGWRGRSGRSGRCRSRGRVGDGAGQAARSRCRR